MQFLAVVYMTMYEYSICYSLRTTKRIAESGEAQEKKGPLQQKTQKYYNVCLLITRANWA